VHIHGVLAVVDRQVWRNPKSALDALGGTSTTGEEVHSD